MARFLAIWYGDREGYERTDPAPTQPSARRGTPTTSI